LSDIVPKRIAFAHYGAKTDVSGVTSWLERLLPKLAERYHGVSLLLHHFPSAPDADFSESSICRSLVDSPVDMAGSNLFEFTEEAVANTVEFLNATQPSCFLPQCLVGFHYAAQWASRQGVPWVFTIHSDDPSYWALGVWVAVSDHIAATARCRFPFADVRVIPCGVSVPKASAKKALASFRIVFSGRLVHEQKRTDLVVAALIQACRMSNKVDAIILGDGPERRRMEAAVSEAQLESRITFKGRLSPSDVILELLQAQAILLMSDYEGLPVAMLEGMACGLVPIARNIASGIPELVIPEVTGLLVDDDPRNAAAAIVSLAEDQGLWQRLSSQARQHVSANFSEEICVEKWHAVIDELCDRGKVQYPIPLPNIHFLPPVNPSLRGSDLRRPGLAMRCRNKLISSTAAAIRLLMRPMRIIARGVRNAVRGV
jgi:colanic acid/amylovoran biosynthesis glycosyltransferase